MSAAASWTGNREHVRALAGPSGCASCYRRTSEEHVTNLLVLAASRQVERKKSFSLLFPVEKPAAILMDPSVHI